MIIIRPTVEMPDEPVGTLTLALRLSIAGKGGIILRTSGVYRTAPAGRKECLSPLILLVSAVQKLREQYPRWGKDKLVVLLHPKGFAGAAAAVGGIITRLKARGGLKEPMRHHVSAHGQGICRPYGIRKPKDYQITPPADLIQLDTLDLRQLPGVILKHFTAGDLVSRWDVVNV